MSGNQEGTKDGQLWDKCSFVTSVFYDVLSIVYVCLDNSVLHTCTSLHMLRNVVHRITHTQRHACTSIYNVKLVSTNPYLLVNPRPQMIFSNSILVSPPPLINWVLCPLFINPLFQKPMFLFFDIFLFFFNYCTFIHSQTQISRFWMILYSEFFQQPQPSDFVEVYWENARSDFGLFINTNLVLSYAT